MIAFLAVIVLNIIESMNDKRRKTLKQFRI
jgi:hypothetical protein